MRTTDRTATCAIPERLARLAALAGLLVLGACEGERGPAGPQGPEGPGGGGGGGTDPDEPTPTEYEAGDAVPEVRLELVAFTGASGPNGEFLVGDTPVLEFTLEKADGEPWPLEEISAGEALVSGPTSNYQRVLPAADVLEDAVELEEGLYRYTFAGAIPATYPAPYNDSTSFGANGGELQGRNLQDGTYTLGLSFTWEYEYAGRPYRRVAELTRDFLLGTGSSSLLPREVTTQAHCDRCHGELQAHDGRYRTFDMCVLCHTSGAEDLNDAAIEGGTTGVTIDSRVLFHKLHAGRFLPSVNGVTTRGNGSRNYDATPVALRYVRADGTVRDFSHVGFPSFLNRSTPLPRDTGYDALSDVNKRKEDLMRSMPSDCATCHGDPDGAGGVEPPAQARQIDVPSRRACGACHDDVDWSSSYRSNGQSMPAQNNDNGCTQCHDSRFDGELAPAYTHRHPLQRSDFNAGIHVDLLAVREAASASDNDGTLDPGEGVELEFTLKNDAGANVQASTLDELHFVLAGPNTNFQPLYDAALPLGLVSGAQPFVVRVPERLFESVGRSTAALDVFETARFPHRVTPQSPTQVFVRTGLLGARGTLVSPVARFGVELVVSDPRGFVRGDVIVIDDGTPDEEYQRVALVEGDRLVLADPNPPSPGRGLVFAHSAGARVNKLRVDGKLAGTDYALDAANGRITELSEFGQGVTVILCYAADYRVPAVYPNPANASDARDDGQGKWTGKELVSGTYVASLSAARELEYEQGTTLTLYRATSPEATLEVLVGDASEPTPYTRVPDATACLDCHQRISYHGLYEGFTTCLTCHGSGGTEDLARATVPDAPATSAVSVEFRDLLHRIHRGRENSSDHVVVGSAPLGSEASFVEHRYDGFATFPSFPDRALSCARCHGAEEAAGLLPSDRSHPDQAHPLQVWSAACLGCHDSQAVRAHFASNTAPDGGEACSICHDPGEFLDAENAHFERQAPH